MQEQVMTSEQASPAHMVEALTRFDGPPQQFLVRMLEVQCRISSAEQAAILRPAPASQAEEEGPSVEIVAMHPARDRREPSPYWLEQAVGVGRQLGPGDSRIMPVHDPGGLYGVSADAHLVLLAMRGGGGASGKGGQGGQGVRGWAVFFIRESDAALVEQARRQLELTVSLLDMYEMRLTLEQRRKDLQRLAGSCSVLSEINAQQRFQGAAMALCNQLASAFSADRVSFGLLRGRYVKVQAMSHTEKLVRKMDLVQVIETAMEESVDQDLEVVHPAPDQSSTISRSAAELSRRFGPACILTVPMRQGDEVHGAVTLERPDDQPFSLGEIEAIRLTVELCTGRLADLAEHDRWFGARWATSCRRGLATLVGPYHTWAKAAAIAVLAFLAFAIFAQGTYRVEAPFKIEASAGQVIAAPFSGYVEDVHVRAGDRVEAGALLASLDTLELQNDLVSALAELEEYNTRASVARAEGERAEQRIANAGAERVEARIDRIQWRLEQAEIRSRLDGIVLTTGDLHKELGRPVEVGQPLFEVAPLHEIEIELAVPESKVAELVHGQRGSLAATSHPSNYLPFEIERIEPMAQIVDSRNVFRVRARLLEHPDWLRPNMEGVAKVDIDQRSYAWIWTHELVNWVRMKLWI